MERFIHDENLALFRKKLADPQLTDEERKVVLKLLADEEARQIASQGTAEDRRPD
ncbi:MULTISPECIES: hypothetical protein [Bradyrhizobium]|jgi:hypothetical protein|uniref:Uncharacterized protein n=1 Tax=Bradyrhizobium elkanii TaxID=29448 RepID=A0A8I2C0F4_BRAEL|nr:MULTISPECIES: hypothetical protein [Bradyrhizobium]MBP1293735.1 hypothetical protein [Bradyrhizobium elkanii]MCP1925681.1 hypothetical protein [Bradyrhizobium elkanii]MCS3451318.1 hypothetical protein [Bradyrhizobium elkanii]MCS3476827.1 hypothetical protein [Bradyrhizobium elkanii]MCS3566657.1 hypothetical protein [Bradyrhizobium elkanii]